MPSNDRSYVKCTTSAPAGSLAHVQFEVAKSKLSTIAISNFVLAALLALPVVPAHADFQMLLESDTDAGAGNEIWVSTFDTYDDLINGNWSGTYTGNNIAAGWSVGGLAWESETYTSVPEPPTWALFGLGFAGLSLARRRRRA